MAMAARNPRRKSLRRKPLEWKSKRCLQSSPPPAADGQFTDTRHMKKADIRVRLEEVKRSLDWAGTNDSARRWWQLFEEENKHRIALVLRLAEELANRKATITEFFLAYVYSNTDNTQANLHYLDYTRLRREEERKRREGLSQNRDDD